MHIWLLVSCAALALFRTVHVLGVDEDFDDDDPWCFQMFSAGSRTHNFLLIGILYPFFLFWTLVGTIWYAEADLQTDLCFKDERQSWYFVLWLVVFYIWIIAYTTAITTSALVYCRQRSFESQYRRLLEDYGDQQVPQMHWQLSGLSPGSINCFSVEVVEKDGERTCSICLEESRVGERMRTLVCGHGFHIACIDHWLIRQSSCPNCKRPLRRRELEEPLLQY
jgi:hypothetical protein